MRPIVIPLIVCATLASDFPSRAEPPRQRCECHVSLPSNLGQGGVVPLMCDGADHRHVIITAQGGVEVEAPPFGGDTHPKVAQVSLRSASARQSSPRHSWPYRQPNPTISVVLDTQYRAEEPPTLALDVCEWNTSHQCGLQGMTVTIRCAE